MSDNIWVILTYLSPKFWYLYQVTLFPTVKVCPSGEPVSSNGNYSSSKTGVICTQTLCKFPVLFSTWQNKGAEGTLIHCYGNTKLTQGPCLYWCVWEDVLPLHQEGSTQVADLHLKPPLMSGQTQEGDKAALGQSPAALKLLQYFSNGQGVLAHWTAHGISNKIMLCTCQIHPIFLEFGHIISSFFSKETLKNLCTLKHLPN